jgi:tetratricopeptide (TPR) repeat protein
MTNEEKFIDTAESYLKGELSNSEKSTFETQIKGDPDAASEFQFLQMMHEGIRESAESDFKAQLKNIHQAIDFSEEARSKKNPLRNILLGVLAIAVIGLAIFFLIPAEKSTERIILENSNPPILALLERSTDAASLKEETAVLWSQKQYAEAIPGLDKLTKEEGIDNSFVLALGYSYFAEKQYGKAKTEFLKLIAANDFLYADQGRWYLALIALQENKEEKAIEILEILAADKSSDSNADAVRLLKELGR